MVINGAKKEIFSPSLSVSFSVRELLHTRKRQDDTIAHLKSVIGDAMISCEIEMVGTEVAACSQAASFLPSAITDEVFQREMPLKLLDGSITSDDISIKMDNLLSPGHTLVQIICQDHKGLLYDVMRTLKDFNIQVICGFYKSSRVNLKDGKLGQFSKPNGGPVIAYLFCVGSLKISSYRFPREKREN